MIRSLLYSVVLLLFSALSASSTVKVSHDDGRWDSIYWWPEGAPGAGDTIIIATYVTGMPTERFGRLMVRAGGTLHVEGMPAVKGMLNEGVVIIDRSASLGIDGDLRNDGAITGEGVVRMTRSGGTIAGSGTFGHLAVGSHPGTEIYLSDSLTIRSLSLASRNRLITGGHDLTVNGAYYSASPFGEPGIVAGEGMVMLNGSINGTAAGNIVIGDAPESRRSRYAGYLEVNGVMGDTALSVRFKGSRRIGFSVLIGSVIVDSGATLEATGIGASGSNTIIGTLDVRGTVAARDESYRLTIDGVLQNSGSIGACTIVMTGFRSYLDGSRGSWDKGINLVYRGPSGGELLLEGAFTVSKLTIEPRSPIDSNVAVITGKSVLKIRHGFSSDIARGCRIVADTIVKVWGASDGMIVGDVIFEGFWGSPVAGEYGAAGGRVRFATRKEIAGTVVATGTLTNDPPSPLTIHSGITVRGSADMRGEVVIAVSGTMLLDGDLTLARNVRGGGRVVMIAPTPTLDPVGTLRDSILLEIGRDSAVTSLSLARSLNGARMLIHPGSSIGYGAGRSIGLTHELRYVLRYASGFVTASSSVLPDDGRASTVFPGNTNTLRYEEGYIQDDTVDAGTGYFVKFPAATTAIHTGKPINVPLTIPIRTGWNLIGGGSIPVETSRITVSGTTLLSGFVTTIGGAQAATTIEPGRGYWVNAAGDGAITLNPGP